MIDEAIDGKWSLYPPFSWIEHPHPHTFTQMDEIAREYGLNYEAHQVITKDGYINQMFRLNNF